MAKYCFLAKNIIYSDDPTTLSFQLLKNVPISESLMLEAMEMNSPVLRIHWIMTIWHSQVSASFIRLVFLEDNLIFKFFGMILVSERRIKMRNLSRDNWDMQ